MASFDEYSYLVNERYAYREYLEKYERAQLVPDGVLAHGIHVYYSLYFIAIPTVGLQYAHAV